MGHLYWSLVILSLGACIGSFLNVVIYRWPRGLSVQRPVRSFCPRCEKTIAGYDNIPVLSFLLLGGRCRHCKEPISLQYPLVEIACALVFLVTYDAFFVARQRMGISDLHTDWPIFIAHCLLWAGMIALAVMDLEAYVVDIRVTWIISAIGLIGHALWTPPGSISTVGAAARTLSFGPQSEPWIRPGPEGAAMAVAAALGLAIGAWIYLRRTTDPPLEEDPQVEPPPAETMPSTPPPAAHFRPQVLWLAIPILLVIVYLASLLTVGEQPAFAGIPRLTRLNDQGDIYQIAAPTDWGKLRLMVGLGVLFVGLTLVAAHPHEEADTEIVEAVTAEAHESRPQAFAELKLLAPAVLLGIAVVLLLRNSPAAAQAVDRCLHWQPVGDGQPLWGLSTGLTGWIIGGAIGWLSRILFTLMFGKEALGMGDVHILAAAGAVAGWPVAFIGFFLASIFALLGIVVIHLRRQNRMLPYGPWLAFAFLVTMVFQDRILIYLGIRDMLVSAPVIGAMGG